MKHRIITLAGTLMLALLVSFAASAKDVEALAGILHWCTEGVNHSMEQQWDLAMEAYERAYEVARNAEPADTAEFRYEVDRFVSALYIHRGLNAKENHHIEEALEWFEKACNILPPGDEEAKDPHSLAGNVCAILAQNKSKAQGGIKAALDYSRRARSHFLAAGDDNAATYELSRQASLLSEEGESDTAINLLEGALKSLDTDYTEHLYLALGEIYRDKAEYRKAIENFQRAFNGFAQHNDSVNVAMTTTHLIHCYEIGLNDKEKADYWEQRRNEWGDEGVCEQKLENPEDNPELANYLDFTQRYVEAAKLVVEGEYGKCITLCDKYIPQAEAQKDTPKSIIADFYALRATAAYQEERFDISNDDFPRALALYEEIGNKNLAQTWYIYAVTFFPQNKPDEAIRAIDKAIKVSEEYLGPLNEQAMKYYNIKVNMCTYWDKYPEAFEAKSRVLEGIAKTVKENLPFLSGSERRTLMGKWEEPARHAFTLSYRLNNDHSEFCDALYDWLLLSKGTMLAADSRLQRAISSDPKLKAEYEALRNLMARTTDPELEPAQRAMLRNQIDFKERDLAAKAQELHHYMDFLNVRVDDVRNALRPGEAAIEFAYFKVGDDSTMYAALVLRSDDEYARFVPLFEARQYDPLKIDADNSALVWGPIMENLHNINKVYFSTSGLLDCSPIESLPLSGGQGYIGDLLQLYRLSSTRLLTDARSSVATGGHATVYGDLLYNATGDDLARDQRKYARERDNEETLADSRNGLLTQELTPPELNELQYSPAEVQMVKKAFERSGNGVKLLQQKEGTEASFKALTGKGECYLHISTHGFYCPENKTTATVQAAQKAVGAATDEDLALTRSGLYMSGAMSAFDKAHPLPEGIDDGILTSLEVSALDLEGLDMVVLSACKTAMGDMKGDGVFGLQRGFKKAGAGSILMSLWNVNDLVTAQLMQAFYRAWRSDKNHPARSKREALEAAKTAIRESYPDPKYWAPFILLDALDR